MYIFIKDTKDTLPALIRIWRDECNKEWWYRNENNTLASNFLSHYTKRSHSKYISLIFRETVSSKPKTNRSQLVTS